MIGGRIPISTTWRCVFQAWLTNNVSPATGKTVAVTISKNGAAFGNPSAGATNATEIANGFYYVDLSTTDTGTAGPLLVRGTASGCEDAYASAEVGSVDANVKTWVGSAPDALSSGKVPADLKLWLTAAPAALSTNGYVQAMLLRWLTDNAAGTPNALQSGRTDSYLGAVATGVIAAASFAANALDAVWSTTTRLLTAGTNIVLAKGTGVTGLNDLDAAAVASATQTGLTAQGYTTTRAGYLDTLNGLVQAVWDKATSALTVVGSIGKLLVDNIDAAISSRTKPADTQAGVTTVTNLTNAPTAGDFTAAMKTSLNAATPAVTVSDKTGFSLSAAGIQAIWDALTAAFTTAGSIGKRVVDYLTGDSYARLGAPVGASIAADLAAVKTDVDALPSASTIATAVAAQVTTDHGAGSYIRNTEPLDAAATRSAVGLASANLDTQLDALPTNAELATALGTADDAVLAAIAALNNLSSAGAQTAAAAALTAYGAALQSTALTIASYIDTEVAAIKAKTDNLPASPAATGDAMALTVGERASVADRLLARNNKGGTDGGLTVSKSLQFGFNRTVFNDDGTYDVYDDDGTTRLYGGTFEREAADTVVSVTPA
jgi:hypothetical protein